MSVFHFLFSMMCNVNLPLLHLLNHWFTKPHKKWDVYLWRKHEEQAVEITHMSASKPCIIHFVKQHLWFPCFPNTNVISWFVYSLSGMNCINPNTSLVAIPAILGLKSYIFLYSLYPRGSYYYNNMNVVICLMHGSYQLQKQF